MPVCCTKVRVGSLKIWIIIKFKMIKPLNQKIKNNNSSSNSSLIYTVWLSWASDYKVYLNQKELFYYGKPTKAIFKTFKVSIFEKFRFRGSFCCFNKETC